MKKNELISGRVQQLRLERGLNREDFGGQIGVTPDYIRMIEGGSRHPSEGLLLAMCYRFNVNEKWIKNGIGKMLMVMLAGRPFYGIGFPWL